MAIGAEAARRAHLAFQRFGLGATPGGLTEALARDPRAALLREIDAPARTLIADPALPGSQAALSQVFSEAMIERRARAASRDDDREMRVARARAAGDAAPGFARPGMEAEPSQASPRIPAAQAPPFPQRVYRSEALARIRKAAEPGIGFAERLVLFWSNHFCVSVAKGPIGRATAGALEREAVRPHVFGRFADMLLAVEKHPAMLFYLDNRQSVGPNSRAGRNRRVGLNENLAREILELHTLGVHGGYSQADVTSLAKIITGWTFAGGEERIGPAGAFAFAANRHEPGEKALLGKVYGDEGVAQGEAALRDLARHPSTAQHVARKLARHFVSDERPPQPLIDRLARVFRDTEGDLAAVSRALVGHDDAWKGDLVKVRTPYEFLAAVARFAGPPGDFGQALGALNALGQPLWAPPGPNGFPDAAAHWASPESMRARLDVSAAIARRLGDRFNPSELADALFGRTLSAETAQAIRRAESKPQGMALLMMSPEFQRR
jgi:uncharacterized protein (DUF1800 family)